jgi:hypothetical protein
MTRRSWWLQKHKFSVMSPDALFKQIAPGPPEHQK